MRFINLFCYVLYNQKGRAPSAGGRPDETIKQLRANRTIA